MKRSIAFISDLHLFSRYALFPSKYVTKTGMVFQGGQGQQKLWAAWEDFKSECDDQHVDTVVVVGDAVHGQNPIERGINLVSSDMDEQVDIGVYTLGPIAKGRKLYMFAGSGYHRSTVGHTPEKDICDRLGGKWMGAIANMSFRPSKRVFNVAHGESAAYVYREMLMGREGMFLRESMALGKIPKIDVFVRGHWHRFIYIHELKMHMVQLPAWMAYEPSKPYLKSYGKMQPDTGGVIIQLDDEDRVRVWHYLYDTPRIVDRLRTA